MIEINIQGLTSDKLVKKIEQEIKRAELNTAQILSAKPISKSYTQTNVQVNNTYAFAKKIGKFLQRKGLNKLVRYIQKTFKLYSQNRVHVMSDFTKYYDEEFIKNAYNLIFYREPDERGKNHYLSLLRSGKLSKTEIIATLYFSKEGREQNIIILGIKKRYMISLIYKIPIFGYVAKIIFTILTIPKLIARINSHENLFYTQLQTKSSNETVSNLAKHFESELKSSNESVLNLQKYLELQINTKSSNETVSNLQKHLESGQKYLETQLEAYVQTLNYAKEYMKETEKNMQNLIDEAKRRLPNEMLNQKQLLAVIEEEKHKFDTFYVEFEDRFRGSRKETKEKVSIYLSYLKNLYFEKEEIRVLDVGCGRGEWLELLKENGYKNLKGIDLNRIMIAKSKEFGLDVLEADAIDYLSNQKDESLSVITGFHIIEHLSFETLMKLFKESYRVLQKGGMAIFETPNPENIVVGACSFYTDPTHKNPLVPDTTRFLLEYNDFKNVEIKRLNGTFDIDLQNDFLNHQFRSQFDYSIIGYKQ